MTLRQRIEDLVQQHGSLRAVARVTEIDVGYLSRLRAGEKVNPEKDKLRRLGLRRVVMYEPLNLREEPAQPQGPPRSAPLTRLEVDQLIGEVNDIGAARGWDIVDRLRELVHRAYRIGAIRGISTPEEQRDEHPE